MPKPQPRLIGSPCADCQTPITEETAMWRSGRRSHHLMSYCRPCYRVRHRESERKRQINGEAALAQRRHYRKMRTTVINGYGGKCACCDESHIEFLALDHTYGGGTKHRKTVPQTEIYRDAIRRNFPSDYRILCHNCNQAVGAYGICPHEQEFHAPNA